ncbi:MAG: hypothetical protein ABIJ47_01320 [Candidatus Bathyarchaeota archaeon]
MNKPELNRTQMAGLILVGLSLVTFIGGGIFVSSWLLSVEPSGVHIYVVDAEKGQHLGKDLVTVTLTGFSYFGYEYPLSTILRASKTTPTCWSFSSSLATMYYVSVTATGYVTQTGKVSMPVNFIAEYTYKLSPEPPDGKPKPEPPPPDEPEPVELEADVYINDVKVAPGDTVPVTTLDLAFKVVVTQGSIEQIWGFVDDERVVFEVADNLTRATAAYRLPGDGSYEVTVRVLDTGGGERPLASFAAVFGDAEAPESDLVDEAIQEALGFSGNLISAALACMGVGVYLLGAVKEEKKR